MWWGTVSECTSALTRLERDGDLSTVEVEQAFTALNAIAATWNEILPSDLVRDRANRLLRVHPLRTGDAFQLASAIVASEDMASKIAIVTFDSRLATAARREGFVVL